MVVHGSAQCTPTVLATSLVSTRCISTPVRSASAHKVCRVCSLFRTFSAHRHRFAQMYTYDFSVQDTACTRPLGTDAVFGGTRTRETRPDAWAHTPSSPHLAPIDGPEYGLMQDLMIAHVDAVHAWPSLEFLTSDVADASVAQHGFGATPCLDEPSTTDHDAELLDMENHVDNMMDAVILSDTAHHTVASPASCMHAGDATVWCAVDAEESSFGSRSADSVAHHATREAAIDNTPHVAAAASAKPSSRATP